MADPMYVERVEVLPVGTESQRGRSNLELARAGFLARYRVESTRKGHTTNLRQWFSFCALHFAEPLTVRAGQIELWARVLEEENGLSLSTVATKLNTLSGFYKYAVAEEYTDRNPMLNVVRPQIERLSPREGLTRPELADLLTAARFSGHRDLALIRLLSINGLRVSEAIGIDIGHLDRHEGEALARITRKYGKLRTIPLGAKTAWAIEQTIGVRTSGPVFLSREGTRLDRAGAGRVVKRLAHQIGVTKHITPHSLRHTFVTLARAAGVPDSEIIATTDHADARMVEYYDRGSKLDKARNATSTVDVFVERAQ